MASISAFGNTGGGSGGTSGYVGTTNYQQVSPTSDPSFAKLLEQIQKITPTKLPGIESIVQGGMNSPLLQLVLGPMLERLQAPQAQARQNLTEQTRAAGGLRGSTYGQDMNKLVQNQALQGNDLMSQVLQQVLGTLVSGSLQSQQNSMLPGKSLTDLLRVITPQIVSGSNQISGGSGSGGSFGRSGMGSPTGTGVSPADRDAQLRGYPDAESMRFQQMLDANKSGGGGGWGGSGGMTGGGGTAPLNTPYLDPWGGNGGGTYDLGMGGGSQYLDSAATQQPFQPIEYGDWGTETVTEGWW